MCLALEGFDVHVAALLGLSGAEGSAGAEAPQQHGLTVVDELCRPVRGGRNQM